MTRYAAVLFDMEGVLLEGRGTPDGIYSDVVSSMIESESVSETEKGHLIAPTDFDSYREVCSKYGVDPEAFWTEKEDAASEREIEYVEDDSRVLAPSAVRTLSDLEQRGVRTGIVSNNSREVVNAVVSHYDLGEFLDVWYGIVNTIDGFDNRKPDPHYIERAIEAMSIDVDAERILYVGDKISDVTAAVAAGTTPVLLFEDRERLAEDPDGLPGHRISQLDDLLTLL